MNGLINLMMERFVRDTYGTDQWAGVMQDLDLGFEGFEALLDYDARITRRLLDTVALHLGKPAEEVLEDIGTYLVSHPNTERVRRLLRFGGVDFVDFLHSLDDLPDRARLALDELHLPALELSERGPGLYELSVGRDGDVPVRLGHVVLGLLRAMADDYGALALLEHRGRRAGHEVIGICLAERDFARGRTFELGMRRA